MLNLTAIKTAKPKLKPYRLTDFGGLCLLVNPNGSKRWRWRYTRPGTTRENMLALGDFPEVSLQEARERRDAARKLLGQGVDPGLQKKAQKAATRQRAACTFGAIANEYFDKRDREVPGSLLRERNRFDNYLTPTLGDVPIGDVSPVMLLDALRRPERAGKLETARRLRAMAGRIFRFAIACGHPIRDPSVDLIGALTLPKPANFAATTDPADLPDLLRKLWSYQGTPVVCAALKLTPYLFVRHGELRAARWADVDLDTAEWRYTVSKTHTAHIVPLAPQAVAILRELHPLTGHREFVFPSARGGGRHMSQVATLAAMRSMGLPAEAVSNHGWRATARTLLDEVLGFEPHLIEHQLAHTVKDPLGRAYNRTRHLPQRHEMMARWASYLDELRLGESQQGQ